MARSVLFHCFEGCSDDLLDFHFSQLLRHADLFDFAVIKIVSDRDQFRALERIWRWVNQAKNIWLDKLTIVFYRNDPDTGEGVGFVECIGNIIARDPDGITAYMHSKGHLRERTGPNRNVRQWTKAMYEACLNCPIDRLMKKYDLLGSFLSEARGLPAPYHFSGTFFWIKNRAVLDATEWESRLCAGRHGVEMWPGLIIPRDRALELIGTTRDLYYEEITDREIAEAILRINSTEFC